MKLAYRLVPDRRPIDLRFVPDSYEPLPGETVEEGSWHSLPIFPMTPLEIQEEADRKVAEEQKKDAIKTNLPSWEQVATAINNAFTNAAQRGVIKRLARIVYWLAKNQLN